MKQENKEALRAALILLAVGLTLGYGCGYWYSKEASREEAARVAAHERTTIWTNACVQAGGVWLAEGTCVKPVNVPCHNDIYTGQTFCTKE